MVSVCPKTASCAPQWFHSYGSMMDQHKMKAVWAGDVPFVSFIIVWGLNFNWDCRILRLNKSKLVFAEDIKISILIYYNYIYIYIHCIYEVTGLNICVQLIQFQGFQIQTRPGADASCPNSLWPHWLSRFTAAQQTKDWKGSVRAIDVTMALGAPIWQKDDVYLYRIDIYIYREREII